MKQAIDLSDALLPGLPVERIRACYSCAPGNEIESGKFASKESSAALVANAFGFFLDDCAPELPPLPGTGHLEWPARTVELERIVRFPWSGGRHPCLDVLIESGSAVMGVESKRYEPFRSKPRGIDLSEAYSRKVWGESMSAYEHVCDRLRDGAITFHYLDAAQLVKHAFGLRTLVHSSDQHSVKKPLLFYLFAEPAAWPDGNAVPEADLRSHREELGRFSELIAGNEVEFRYCSYRSLLAAWHECASLRVRNHAAALAARFPLL